MLYALLFGGLALAAVGGGAYLTGRGDGVDAQKTLDEPVIAQARAARDVAIAANEGLRRDVATIRTDVAACNQKVAAVKADSDIAIATMGKLKEESEKRQQDYAKILANYRAGARPAQPVAADQQCSAAKATLVNLSETMTALEALGLSKPGATLTITDPSVKAPPKSAIKTLPGVGK